MLLHAVNSLIDNFPEKIIQNNLESMSKRCEFGQKKVEP